MCIQPKSNVIKAEPSKEEADHLVVVSPSIVFSGPWTTVLFSSVCVPTAVTISTGISTASFSEKVPSDCVTVIVVDKLSPPTSFIVIVPVLSIPVVFSVTEIAISAFPEPELLSIVNQDIFSEIVQSTLAIIDTLLEEVLTEKLTSLELVFKVGWETISALKPIEIPTSVFV